MTDHIFEEIKRYVTAVPPASAAARDSARRRWDATGPMTDTFADRSEVETSTDITPSPTAEQPASRRGLGVRKPFAGTQRRSLRLTTIAAAASIVAVALVATVAVEHHLGGSAAHQSTVAGHPGRCSTGPDQLRVAAPSGHGPYPLVTRYQFVVLQPITDYGIPVSGLRAGRSAAVFIWRDGAWKPETPLRMPAPRSGGAQGRAIVQFTSQYPVAQRYLLQVPFDRVDASAQNAKGRSLLLCATVVISGLTPGVTTTDGG